MFCAALAVASLSTFAFVGCSRVVLVTEASPTRIGPDTRARLYTLSDDGKWTLGDNRVEIPEGWYLCPPSYVAEEK